MPLRSSAWVWPTLWLGWTLLASLAARAQPNVGAGERPLTALRWTEAEGLPDDTVNALAQTPDGYLWVGTARGLARFDGIRFEILPPPSREPTPAAITALQADSAGRLWLGTEDRGLYYYAEGKLQRFDDRGTAIANGVTSLTEDTAGSLWVGTRAGLDRIQGGNVTHFSAADGLPSDWVTSIHATRSGAVWVTTRGGMCQYERGRWRPLQFQAEGPGRSPEFIGVYEDRSGNLWAFGDTYLVNLGEGKRFNYFRSGDASSRRIWSLCEGRQGQLWIGTSGQGLLSFREGKFQPLALREGVLSSDVRALWEDADENLWLGTRGGGLTRLQWRGRPILDAALTLTHGRARCLAADANGRRWAGFERGGLMGITADRWEEVGARQGFELLNLVASLWPGPDGELWAGTLGCGLYRLKDRRVVRFSTDSGLADNDVLAVAAGPDGTVWAGTRAGTIHRLTRDGLAGFGREQGLPGGPISALLPTGKGGLWAGTETGDLLRWEDGRFATVRAPWNEKRRAIRALGEDALHRLWVGGAGAGLACLTQAGEVLWSNPAGTGDDEVFGVLSDSGGNLWYGADRGIFRVPWGDLRKLGSGGGTLHARQVYESEPGLGKGLGRGWPGAVRLPDGHLWFAMPGGQVTVDPAGWETPPRPLPVHLEGIRVNGGPLVPVPRSAPSPSAAARLPTRLRSLEFQFTALDLSAPERLRLQHRLEGFDPDWVESDRERRARYGPLPRGEYRFRVRATRGDGAWAEAEDAFAFVLPTPAWQSSWALTAFGLALAGLVAGVARVVSHRRLRRKLARLAQQQATEKERVRIARDMHDEIGSKLTKISFLSELAMRGGAPENLQAIANTSRDLLQTLDELVWAVNPHNDTLEQLAAYLGQYAAEYLQNTTLELELTIAEDLPAHPLSAEIRHGLFLAFEEALGNALKHARASKIQVRMAMEAAEFTIEIRDNGRGFDPGPAEPANDSKAPSARQGNGLVNMRQRLAAANGGCQIESRPGAGALIRFRLPLSATEPILL